VRFVAVRRYCEGQEEPCPSKSKSIFVQAYTPNASTETSCSNGLILIRDLNPHEDARAKWCWTRSPGKVFGKVFFGKVLAKHYYL
jgi:hypothetical protein